MDPLSMLAEIVRSAYTLHILLNQDKENRKTAQHLHESLAKLEHHIYIHYASSGKTLQYLISADIFHSIVSDLNLVKSDLQKLVSGFQKQLRPVLQAIEVKEKLHFLNDTVKNIKDRLETYGLSSNIINYIDILIGKVNELAEINRDNKYTLSRLDSATAQHTSVLLQLARTLKLRVDSETPLDEIDDSEQTPQSSNNISVDSSSDSVDVDQKEDNDLQLFSQVPNAVQHLTSEIKKAAGDQESNIQFFEQVTAMWTCWQIQKADILFETDEDEEPVQLGRGASGDVYAGYLKISSEERIPVAIKSVFIDRDIIPDLLREVFLHLSVQHNTVLHLFGMYYPRKGSGKALILVERMACSVADAMRDGIFFDATLVLRDTAAAIAHLHARGVVHRDIKPANILISEDGLKAKISDFGSSRRRSANTVITTTIRAGTQLYMPPEVLNNVRCKSSWKWDSWSFGIVMCELLYPQGCEEYLESQQVDAYKGATEWAGKIVDERLRKLALWCVQNKPSERPTMKIVYLHLDGALPVEDMSTNPIIEPHVSPVSMTPIVPVPPPDPAEQRIGGRNWTRFFYVMGGATESRTVSVCIDNQLEMAVVLSRLGRTGHLVEDITIEPDSLGQVWKDKKDNCLFFVLKESETQLLRAAFVVKGYDRRIIINPGFIQFCGYERDYDIGMETQWPVRSLSSGKEVDLKIMNKTGWDWSVEKLDENGMECSLVKCVGGRSIWNGKLHSGALLALRFRRDFRYLVSVPVDVNDFSVIF